MTRMILMLGMFGTLSILELLIHLPGLKRSRIYVAMLLVIALGAGSGWLLASEHSLLAGLLVIINAYRIINMLRIIQNKMHEQYLQRVTLRTSVWLSLTQAILVTAWNIIPSAIPGGWPLILAAIQYSVALALLAHLRRRFKAIKLQPPRGYLADRDLPSISICIPARNETLNLEACLKSVLASDYPKLEVLVLDDASHDRTPDIIKSFAHDGVRFIRGDTPPGTWLAKNWAYQRLYEEATGKYLLFCGVDARFEPDTFRLMMRTMLEQPADMYGFIPRNIQPVGWRQEFGILLQPMRYAWELCLPRTLFKRPPVLSTCWLAGRKFIRHQGGFGAVARMVTPESYFARQAAAKPKNYRLMAADASLRITTSKLLADQWDTAVRTRYPQIHKRPELILFVSTAELLAVVLPYIFVIYGILTSNRWLTIFAMLSVIQITALYSLIVAFTYRRFQWRALLLAPIAAILDIYIRNYSMWRYEFKEVTWKGRDVTAPVMHVLPRLPALEEQSSR